MARKNSTQSIAPFPANIDRDAFGHWLSGFADGEATFNLYAVIDASDGRRESLRAAFRIALRADDTPTIRQIQSFWNCGTVTYADNARCKIPNAKPVITLNVSKIADVVNIVVPHFERYPPRSKKRTDFSVWKQGVSLIWEASQRPHPCAGVSWYVQRGTTKWLDHERRQFKLLVEQLKSSRCYDAAPPLLEPRPPAPEKPPAEASLFDRLED